MCLDLSLHSMGPGRQPCSGRDGNSLALFSSQGNRVESVRGKYQFLSTSLTPFWNNFLAGQRKPVLLVSLPEPQNPVHWLSNAWALTRWDDHLQIPYVCVFVYVMFPWTTPVKVPGGVLIKLFPKPKQLANVKTHVWWKRCKKQRYEMVHNLFIFCVLWPIYSNSERWKRKKNDNN